MIPPLEIKSISFREIQERDLPFLQRVYKSTRETELSQVPWSEQDKMQFIAQQFYAQHQYYQEQFSGASFKIIMVHGEQAGRLYLEERNKEYRIIDIAFLPGFRGQGWGTKILQKIQSMARKQDVGIGIHVEKNNPAMNLYLRLGFENIEDKGVYQFMMWEPERINQ